MQRLAGQGEDFSNLLLNDLADWNEQLKHAGIDFSALPDDVPDPEAIRAKLKAAIAFPAPR